MAYAYNQEVDPKILEELKGQSTELLNRLGCGQKYADGGRIKFGEDVILDAIYALPYFVTGDFQGAIKATTPGFLGAGKSREEELLEVAKDKESVQRALTNLKLVPELKTIN
jgi:hypothetical protein